MWTGGVGRRVGVSARPWRFSAASSSEDESTTGPGVGLREEVSRCVRPSRSRSAVPTSSAETTSVRGSPCDVGCCVGVRLSRSRSAVPTSSEETKSVLGSPCGEGVCENVEEVGETAGSG